MEDSLSELDSPELDVPESSVPAPAAPGCQPAGGWTSTMLWHLGQFNIWPMAAASRTFNRALQVGQTIEKASTVTPV
jgi:hypothetical protein